MNTAPHLNTVPRRPGRPQVSEKAQAPRDMAIGLRLPPAEMQRAKSHAERESRSLSNFARRVYLIGLAQYEAEQARTATHA